MKRNYDVIIVGGGVQGLSLAYNLAKNGGGNIAVFEKGYIGSGASGRNGEMLRSAFASKEWIRFFDKSLQLWETLAGELEFNVMYTRCGYLILASTQDMARKFVRLFPGLGGVRLIRQWAGIVDMTPDIAPLLGPVKKVEGFILNCGWVYGFVGAPATGYLLARYILSGQVPAEIQPFNIERFERGEPIIDRSLVVPSEAEKGVAH